MESLGYSMEEEKEVRNRKSPLKVYVTDSERDKITSLAQLTKKAPSAYMRDVALGYQPKSVFDREAIQTLVKLHADQGRLGGLLKLWLVEKKGEGVPVKDVRSLLRQIESLQMELAQIVMSEKKRL
jgi:hypothetical protein